MFSITVNGNAFSIDADGDTPLLWILRDHLKLTGTKFGCGIGECGACTVKIGASVVRACQIPLKHINAPVTTIEGLNDPLAQRLRDAWTIHHAVQCGYCQPAQILSAHALFEKNKKPSTNDIEHAMSSVLCRCGTYPRIKNAIDDVAKHT